MKRFYLLLIALFIITGCGSVNNSNITIITTNYPCYDFVRSIVKDADDVSVSMLLSPGEDMHNFEVTPKNIINIKNSNIFVYVGGESDTWISNILKDEDLSKTKQIKLMDLVSLEEEAISEGMEGKNESIEYDEHVWTSPKNVIEIIKKLKDIIIEMDKDNEELYEKNANDYILQVEEIDKEIRNVIANGKRKEIVFADRFPLTYFVNEYKLDYYAAFKGCSEDVEASSKTIAFLINKIKSDNIPVVFHLELGNSKMADVISKETGAKVLEFNSFHNVSLSDYKKGITYIDVMKRNIAALKEALN